MDRVDALSVAQTKMIAVEETIKDLGNIVQELSCASDPLNEAYYWRITTQRLIRHAAKMEQALDILISEMETVASWRTEDANR